MVKKRVEVWQPHKQVSSTAALQNRLQATDLLCKTVLHPYNILQVKQVWFWALPLSQV